jgi:hypothetical protein
MKDQYTTVAEDVIQAEQEHIRQSYKNGDNKKEFYGLALSGGGIRSASFCLGILQALVGGRILEKIDYLSTASGGGYLGSALTWFLHKGLPGGVPAGTEPDNFPFGQAGTGARLNNDKKKRNPNAILDFLRQHSNYLAPGNGLDFISFTGFAIRTIFVSLLVYFSLAALTLVFIQSFGLLHSFTHNHVLYIDGIPARFQNLFLLAAAVLVAFFAVFSIFDHLVSRVSVGGSVWRYQFRAYNQVVLGLFLKLIGVALLFGSLPVAHDFLDDFHAHIQTAGASTVAGTLLGWYRYYRQQKAAKPEPQPGKDYTSIIAAGLIIYGLALGAFILAEHVLDLNGKPFLYALAVLAAAGLGLGVAVNLNYSGLHRMYRDRLMEIFTPDLENVVTNRWGLATEADDALLEDMCQGDNRRPYHLLNANLVLVNSPTEKYRSRGGDNFIMSPLYCGSYATGWRRSSDYMKKGSRGLTLPTAMAVSGAALNPNAANNGRGTGRNRWVSILYTLLNLRLGYWALNPKLGSSWWRSPNFIDPGVVQSIFGNLLGNGFKEQGGIVELSDGGHFDNTGLYELIRRKLKVIIACDGGADGKFTFDDLANAIERVRVDFGARILFDDPELDLRWVLPESAGTEATDSKYSMAKCGFAVATIYYADESVGKLLYIKATMTRGLPTDIYSYKSANPTFPHQATADQFFDEVQIESYRELGYYLGWQLLEANGHAKPGQKINLKKAARWI